MSRTEKLSDKGEEHEKIEKGKEGEGEVEKEQGALVVDKAPGVRQIFSLSLRIRTNPNKGASQKKNTGFFGSFSHTGGGGSPKSQNFCDLTK